MELLRWLFPRIFLWNNGVSPYNNRRWRELPYCEDGPGIWPYTDGERTIAFTRTPPKKAVSQKRYYVEIEPEGEHSAQRAWVRGTCVSLDVLIAEGVNVLDGILYENKEWADTAMALWDDEFGRALRDEKEAEPSYSNWDSLYKAVQKSRACRC